MKAIAIILLFLPKVVNAQVLNISEIESLNKSIVKIFARHSDQEIAATGFLYGNSRSIVTSLHVVSGASAIQVKLSSGGSLISAKLSKILKSQDLALLTVENPIDRPALINTNSTSKRNDSLLCLGYFSNIPTISDTALKVRATNNLLKEIIPPKVKRELDKLPYLDTNISILNLDGHLLPGHSGAPIFNDKKEIVAIANGGLAVGAASRSWGISSSYLKSLLNSTEELSNISSLNTSLFSEEISSNTKNISVTNHNTNQELIFIRKATLEELHYSTDDRLGFSQIVSTFQPRIRNELSNYQYNIFRDKKSGATLVIPDFMNTPSFEEGFWKVSNKSKLVTLYYRINYGSNPQEINTLSSKYEQDVISNDNPWNWSSNPAWTYPQARLTFDGMYVRRLAYQKWSNLSRVVEKQLITTFSSRNSLLLSASAKLNNNKKIIYPFGFNDRDPDENNEIWLAAASSVFFTTLSN